ncbi:cell division ATP-binding protein FtsE [Gammaproteobacteria bacterium]|jgi:cell division transport system ATP-binding protein|nr:cell division ATP-binding protein FtsE [Gammaproteobacteria bacterium]MDC3196570.1 cell division ATP-binding protein FtsE [Gammaproteobacteria bacterium]HAS48519.1 cell division ATP-binding protein FtsE [Gammaproteobacteria bacterium]
MIKFDNISKRYADGQEALVDVSFEVSRGELAFITGHSGAGKSTLLKLILAIESPSSGQLIANGINLSRISSKQIALHRRQIGTVFQDHQLLHDRSVFDNVALPLEICGYHPTDAGRRVRAALDKVGLLKKEKSFPAALSGGEQQRVGIARAVVNRPRIILADEPTGNLDPALSREVMEVFEQFQSVGVCLLVASHNASLIERLNCRTLVLDSGRLVADQKPRSDS